SAQTSCTTNASASAMVAIPTARYPIERSNAPHPIAANASSAEKIRADNLRRSRKPFPGASSRSRRNPSDIELLHFRRALHDELEARAHVLAEQIVDRLLGLQRLVLGDRHLQGDALLRVERGALQLVGGHLAEALEAHDVRLGVALALVGEDPRAVGVVERPVRVLADLDLVERWLGEEDVALPDQVAHVPVEEG